MKKTRLLSACLLLCVAISSGCFLFGGNGDLEQSADRLVAIATVHKEDTVALSEALDEGSVVTSGQAAALDDLADEAQSLLEHAEQFRRAVYGEDKDGER